jgi:hypothetical protein
MKKQMDKKMTHEELENWEAVRYRMDEEGIDYCFNGYSRWEEIEDEEFHRLKNEFLKSMKDLKDYINNKVKEGRELELEGELEDE